MKITIYTINDCVFCNQEKEYLKSHNLPFEEKNLEVNREFLTEMLTLSNNFAGTPVTKIEKDDQSVIVLKGFTKEEFDDVLGFSAPAAQVAAPVVTPATVAPVAMPAPVVSAPVVAPVAPAPVAPAPASHDAIASQIAELQRLQAQLAAQTAVPAPVVAPMPPVQVDAPVVAPAPVVPPQPEPVVQAPVSMPTPAPVVAAPTVAAPTAAVDDSLASILAELQAKINAQQAPGSTTGQAN
jgi:glutaredoxin